MVLRFPDRDRYLHSSMLLTERLRAMSFHRDLLASIGGNLVGSSSNIHGEFS
jgi:hypothetical protein